MKIICVTGAPGSDVGKVADIFFAAGVKPAQPLRQDASFTLAGWHEKVIAAAGGGKAVPAPVQQPGRFWEQFATNLFMENMQQPLWAWADPRSVWLLDFWQQFEPTLHFVLVYTSPQRALAEALAAEREHGVDTATLMAAWEAHQKELLRFHHRNPGRTILVDAEECAAAPNALLEACTARWNLDLAPTTAQFPASPAPAPLVGYLAEQLRQKHPELQALQQELESSLHALQPAPADRLAGPDLFAAVENYRQVHSAALRADALVLEIDALSGQLAQAAGDTQKLADEKSEYASAIVELKQTVAKRETEVTALKALNAELKGESDQIILQMHQLQEELELNHLENKRLGEIKSTKKRTIDELNKKVTQYEASVATLKQELDAAKANKAAEKEKADALTVLATVKKELETLKANKTGEKEKAEALAALATVKRELESVKANKNGEKEKTEALAALASVKKELETVKANKTGEKEKADALAALANARKELDAARQGIKRLESEQLHAKEAQEENDLLLVQLHQVQEELEHYFVEHKNAVKQNGTLALRWQRMLERNPAYCDYQSLELLDVNLADQRTSWRFTDLSAAGHAYPELRFDTIITDGVAVFAFARNGVAPGAPDALDSLTTAEWTLLPMLCRVLDEALQAPTGSLEQLDESERSALRQALAALVDVIDRTSAVLRFDRVTLKREQVNSDYEHLWLQIGNLSLGERRWNNAEFRLSCANVRPGKFGAHPKIEFPSDAGAVLFDSWFAESYDDFGDKLELRFALPESMDMAVWEKLSVVDRETMKALVAILPAALTRLEDSRTTLARPFADWQSLAVDVGTILATRTDVPATASAPLQALAAPDILSLLKAAKGKKAGVARKGII